MAKKRFDKPKRVLGYALLGLGAVLAMLPLLWLLDVAFRPKIEIFQVPPVIFQTDLWHAFSSYSWDSFAKAMERQAGLAFLNSVFVTGAGILLTLLVCSLCAFAFAFMNFRGKTVIFIGILATMMLPTVTMIAPYYQLLRTLGLTNSHAGLIVPYAASAFGVFLLRQYFICLPYSLYEAAVIDGAGPLRVWWRVVLPLSKPALAALAIIQFRLIWNDFMMPMIVLRDESLFTLPVKLQMLDSTNINVPYDAIMATGLIAAAIPVIFFLIFQRQFVEGLSGGIKG
jgi:ABC-type glycerol-3-phosphate transport system permease component